MSRPATSVKSGGKDNRETCVLVVEDFADNRDLLVVSCAVTGGRSGADLFAQTLGNGPHADSAPATRAMECKISQALEAFGDT